ncbi:polymorphic toxin-type HINT domain-containing protein [Streptomyces sp. NBC_01497]|uniref:polymorphic toxin-type HINT domain-containing protein n=1 Tax=Streptomyces sp. NBC_01497 TaxID=2903885 RepID=UPI002E37E87E|nr:polymorphic toxin-type HINT domain-containing protein [Streptomyces sp. NBC_01497]
MASGAVTATLLGTAPATWANERHGHHTVQADQVKPGTAVPFKAKAATVKDPEKAAAGRTSNALKKAVTWPKAADVTLAVASADHPGKAESVGGLPVQLSAVPAPSVAAPHSASVQVADHATAVAAGADGALVSVSGGVGNRSGKARLTLDYSGFADAFGGDYASRLSLVQLPACALTTPDTQGCRTRTPVKTDNDIRHHTLTATVALPQDSASQVLQSAMATSTSPASPRTAEATGLSVIAATAAPSSGAGSYQATSLSPSASWQAGGSSGDFNWSYPLSVPPSSGGPAPSLAIGYDSQSVDGRLPSTNNQPSWVGEGWDLPTSYIERAYDSCDDDGQSKKYDECWANDNATLVLNGQTSPLIKDSKTGEWHPKDDDGERVTRSTGAVNGDNDGEYWTVTTADGMQYVFGENRLPGWGSGKSETNSTWTVPVFGDDAGEPCHASTFADSSCDQAWRWNLDYVVDTHGNAMSYWYTKEVNYYAKNGTTTANGSAYDRGGYLSRIDYGLTASSVFGTAPDEVAFTTAERCVPTSTEKCDSLTSTTAEDWPDVPFDQICASGKICKDDPSPTFFSRKRLTGVTTKVWDTSVSPAAYKDVDSWQLDHSFPDPGDGTSAGLWLNSITRTGQDGKAVAMKPVTFAGVQMTNRVDTTHDDIAALVKWRVRTITSETGSVLTVNYSDPQCVVGSNMPSAPDSDTKLCYPTYWTPPFTDGPELDYFHKYVVQQVLQSDPTGGAPLQETDYTYSGSPAWHYDTDDVTSPAKRITWSQWRGYGSVTTTSGDAQSTRTKTVDSYFRGMDGDKQADGSKRSVKITDSQGTAVTDAEPLAGSVREEITYDGSHEVSGTVTDEWIHQTGTDGTRESDYTDPAAVYTRTDLSAGGTRDMAVHTTYDPDTGAPIQVDDDGDTNVSGDEQCTRTTLANNNTAWLRAVPTRVEIVDVGCDATPKRPDDVISDNRTLYDGKAFGTAPSVGDETSTQRLTSYQDDAPVYQTVSTSAYDSQGRVTTVTDAAGHTTKTTYTPATGGPLTSTDSYDAKNYKTTTVYDPSRGLATSVVDPNSKRTDYGYDALGRLTSIWLPNRSKAANQTASLVYDYELSNSAASYVRTGKLRNDGSSYDNTYAIYDALLRPRQSQTPAPGGGRVITETKYDTRGLAVESDADYTDGTDASGTLANITSAEPAQTLTTYDGAGRATAQDFYAGGTKKWTTTTSYGGDRTTVVPPKGGVATTTLADTLGRTTETRQYDNGTASGSYTSITYHYDSKSHLSQVTDGSGNSWHYDYDLLGRKTSTTDPDGGTSTVAYDDLDQTTSTTDSRGKTLSYTYDELGRKTAEYDGTVQDADHQLAKWTYDTIAKGQPASSVRYVGGSSTTGKAYTSQVVQLDALYRPTLSRVTVPSVTGEEGLAGTYTFGTAYNLDGTQYSATDPAVGGLPSESEIYGYNELGMPKSLQGRSGYVLNTVYTKPGDVSQITLGTSTTDTAKWAQISNTYEDGTRRLTRQLVTDDTGTGVVQDTNYTYDDSGNPTSVDTRADGVDDTQCYSYDGHDRLTEAWTPTDGCAASPSEAMLGGPAPYWQSYGYDQVGDRTKLVNHGTGSEASDATTTYTYPVAGSSQPHALDSSVTTQPGQPDKTDSYDYDSAGNTTTRTVDGKTQHLAWDDEGNLSTVTNADGTTVSYLYDPDGNRLLSRDSTGTTLYLGDTEVHLGASATVATATRYYTWAGQTVAVRTSGGGLSWVLSDGHGTATTQIDSTTQAVVRRYSDPFGNPRGPEAATDPTGGADSTDWLGDKGFVDGIQDTDTGLTHLGAREYDSTTGRFVSLDPVLEVADPNQINGYAYAANNPVGESDPTGMTALPGNAWNTPGVTNNSCSGANQPVPCAKAGSSGGGGHPGSSSGNSSSSSAHKSCGWSLSCRAKQVADGATHVFHKAYHAIAQHPVIATVVATAVVAGAIACVVATAGGCAAVIVGAATGLSEGAAFGGTAAVLGAATGAAAESGAVVLGAAGLGGTAAAALEEGTETASAESSASSSGADAAASDAESTASSGSADAPKREAQTESQKCSFAPGTKVLMAKGKTKAIVKIKPGDKVQAADPKTVKHKGPRTVEARWVNHDHDLLDVTVKQPTGSPAILHTTSNHPFWDTTTHAWTQAGDLKPGETLTTDKSARVTVVAVHVTPGAADRYNLTVNELHTYYVFAGTTPVLVHNCNSGTAPNGAACSCSGSTNPSNADLVQAIATRAQARLGGSGAVSGTAKHAYADTLLTRYQGIYGNRGLITEKSYLGGAPVPRGTAGSARPDVFDPAAGVVYDYKFVKNPGQGIGKWQADKNALNVPGVNLTVEVNP